MSLQMCSTPAFDHQKIAATLAMAAMGCDSQVLIAKLARYERAAPSWTSHSTDVRAHTRKLIVFNRANTSGRA